MGKASVSNITGLLGFAVAPKALAMAHWSAVASPLVILPLPPSRFRPLAPYCPLSWHLTAKNPPPAGTRLLPPSGWHPTATHRLAPYCSPSWLAPPLLGGSARPSLPLRSFGPSSVTPSRRIALPPWLCPTRGNDVMTCPTVHHGFWWALNI